MGIQRIVKMTFKEEHCMDFENYFESIKDKVAGQPGCSGVKLLKDVAENGVYFTYSYWQSQSDLNAYRNTSLFGAVWPKVKKWFADKPEAWSTQVVTTSNSEN
ncbi:putative quinol monooxygenase [Crocinitomix algicola]|uniref:putative quinol monooxygenase n=1 Tax=Crocinitomix algicola TaxID=1740263 RepID=UPI0008360A9F|nr:antibiotic biosynthesis monooxygenase family protein [Crocinitomix algicola]